MSNRFARIGAFAIFFFIVLVFLGRYFAMREIPVPYWDWGACPGCSIGQRLVVNSSAHGYKKPALSPESVQTEVTNPHDVIEIIDSLLLVKKAGIAVMIEDKVIAGAPVKKGENVYTLSVFPECAKAWFVNPVWNLPLPDRQLQSPFGDFDVCWGEADVVQPSVQDWWLLAKNRRGETFWLMNPDVSDTDRVLLAALAAEPHVLDDKLEAVDALIQKGADLNGPEGKHDQAAAEIVIESFDIAFVGEMARRGMKVEDGVLCSNLVPKILRNQVMPGYFDRLLAEGYLEHCKQDYQTAMGLLFGSALVDFDVDQAIQSASKLRDSGFDLNIRDPRGVSVTGELAMMVREERSWSQELEWLLFWLKKPGGVE